MAKYLLYHVRGSGDRHPIDVVWIDKWCAMYRVRPVIIDVNGVQREKDSPPYFFPHLEEAVVHPDFAGHSWVWLDPEATHFWDEVELPRDNVVYCIGDDYTGFDGFEFEGQRVKLRPPERAFDGEWYAAMVVPMLLFEVYNK